MLTKSAWAYCPICGSKTRDRIGADTILENYPLPRFMRLRDWKSPNHNKFFNSNKIVG